MVRCGDCGSRLFGFTQAELADHYRQHGRNLKARVIAEMYKEPAFTEANHD